MNNEYPSKIKQQTVQFDSDESFDCPFKLTGVLAYPQITAVPIN